MPLLIVRSLRLDRATMAVADSELPDGWENHRLSMKFMSSYLETGLCDSSCTTNDIRRIKRSVKRYVLRDGSLLYKKTDEKYVDVITCRQKVEVILNNNHGDAVGGHSGINATLAKISQAFWWHGMKADVKEYVSSCPKCQSYEKIKTQAPVLQPIKVYETLELVGIDLIGPLPLTKDGNRYVLTITDYFTKFVEFFALKDKTAAGVCAGLKSFICRWGPPKRILSDQGREFVNELNSQLCRQFNIDRSVTSAYHPQTNGLDERTNSTLKTRLSKLMSETKDDWDTFLEEVAFSIRCQPQATNKCSPFFLMFGRHPRQMLKMGDTPEVMPGPLEDVGPLPDAAPGPLPDAAPGPLPDATPGPLPEATPGPLPDATPGPLPDVAPGPLPDVAPGSLPDATPGPLPDATPGPLPDVAPGSLPDATPGPLPDATPGPLPDATPGPLPDTTPGPLPDAAPGPLPDATPGPLPDATPGPLPDATPGPLPDVAPGSLPDATPGPLPDTTPGPLPDAAPGPLPDATPGPLPDAAPGPLPDATPGPLPDATPAPLPDATPAPLPDAAPAPLPDVAPGPLPDATPGPLPDATPAPLPDATPAPLPDAAPAPLPDVAPGPLPDATPGPLPDATPAPLPDAAPAPLPDAAPGPLPDATPGPLPDATPAPLPDAAPAPLPDAAPGPLPDATPGPLPDATPAPLPDAAPAPLPDVAPGSLPDVAPATRQDVYLGLPEVSDQSIADHLARLLDHTTRVYQQVQENQDKAHQKDQVVFARRASKKTKTFFINKGDLVLKRNMKNVARKGGKMDSLWTGPHRVLDIDKSQTVQLQSSNQSGPLARRVPYCQLKPFKERGLAKAIGQESPENQVQDQALDLEDILITGIECAKRRGAEALPAVEATSQLTQLVNMKDVLACGGELTDLHIDHASSLLRLKFPAVSGHQRCSVFESAGCQRLGTPAGKFVQIVLMGRHWITVSNVHCKKTGHVKVYDSLYKKTPANCKDKLEKQLAWLLYSDQATMKINRIGVQQQDGAVECGLFAIAFAETLCAGLRPERCTYNETEMRGHLASCFDSGSLTPFPQSDTIRLGKPTGQVTQVKLHCNCRQPNDKNLEMVQCDQCQGWFHPVCQSSVHAIAEGPFHCTKCLQ